MYFLGFGGLDSGLVKRRLEVIAVDVVKTVERPEYGVMASQFQDASLV